MDDVNNIRQRKLAEMQARIQEQQNEEGEARQQVAQLEAAVKQHMDGEALERYGNVKTVHPETAVRVLIALAQAINKGVTRIDDALLKRALAQLNQNHDIKITRK